MNPKTARWIDALLLLVALAWGTTYATAKTITSVQSISTFLALRFGLAALVTTVFVRKDLARITRDTLKRGALLGLPLALTIAIETLGITLTSPSNAGVLISMTILFVPLIEGWTDPSFSLSGFLPPAFLSFLGCVLLTAHGGITLNRGDPLILVAAVTRAVHLIASKKLGCNDSTSALATIQFAVVGLCALAVSTASGHFANDLAQLDLKIVGLLSYMIVVCTVFAFFVQLKVVRYRSASHVGLLLGTEPVFAAVIGATLSGDRLSPTAWVGVAVVVAATYWAQSRARIRLPAVDIPVAS